MINYIVIYMKNFDISSPPPLVGALVFLLLGYHRGKTYQIL